MTIMTGDRNGIGNVRCQEEKPQEKKEYDRDSIRDFINEKQEEER